MPRKPTTPVQDDLMTEFKALVGDTEKLLQHTAELAGDQASELRNQLYDNLKRARETLHSSEESLREHGRAALESTEGYVQDHPWQSIGVSAGVGFLLGLLAARH
ncbi:hypothetical protein A9179_08875 [Pseudomonas alcaligenes]|uniref:DUF883 domain-containing protein n=1 Tax=Aquipseudomonas alcaligenes TaxID=43263 RepID=A0ABR7S0Y7_AQUAC|nr:YqjD family protein [Pseudomonas alcaligenes]MBC9250382.1 hypothetical protein [Pseudomonas alcaligenes]